LGYKLLKIEERKRLGNHGYNNVMVGFSLPNVGTKLEMLPKNWTGQ